MCAGFTERSLAHSAAPRSARNQRSPHPDIRNKHATVTLVFHAVHVMVIEASWKRAAVRIEWGRTALAQGET
jgi:hypothetical protein